jgi:hypothetical protein
MLTPRGIPAKTRKNTAVAKDGNADRWRILGENLGPRDVGEFFLIDLQMAGAGMWQRVPTEVQANPGDQQKQEEEGETPEQVRENHTLDIGLRSGSRMGNGSIDHAPTG